MSEIDANNIYTQLGLNKPSDQKTRANDELGQAQFLELMTAQLQYQDPLKPMENGDFLGQMAQFGTVSGINDLNTTVSSMNASFQSNQALQASTLVGRRVMVPSQTAFLKDGEPLIGSVDLERTAARGIEPGDVHRAAAVLVSGITVGNLFEEQKVFDVVVWGAPELRDEARDVPNLLIDKPGRGHVLLGEVAEVTVVASPAVIRHPMGRWLVCPHGLGVHQCRPISLAVA